MRRRSASKRCLLCLTCCSSLEGEEEFACGGVTVKTEGLSSPQMVMAGAVNCKQLQRQLEHMFILRKILDIPESWCQETLLHQGVEEREGNGDLDGGGDPANWFTVCAQCMESSVTQAWKVYQQILALEVKMLEIKEKVRGRMREELMKPQNRSWRAGGADGGVEGKIRSFIFPDFVPMKFESVEVDADAALDCEVDMDYSDEDWMEGASIPNVDPLVEDEEDSTSSKKRSPADFPFRLFKEKRGRGRPARRRGRAGREFRLDESSSTKKKTWHCCNEPQCRSRYRSPEELAAHMKRHQERQENEDGEGNKRELDCPLCPFPARDAAELELHLEIRHRSENRMYHFNCPKCDFKVQDDFASLKRHYDQEHPIPPGEGGSGESQAFVPSQQPIPCSLCPKICNSLKSFNKHQRDMHPEQVGLPVENLECDQCGVKFITQFQLQCHVSRKHGSHQSSRFVCDECGQGFQYSSQLEHHKITHVGKWKRDFVCHLCGLDYAYKWILESHYRQCHPAYQKGGGDAAEDSNSSAPKKRDLDHVQQPGKEFKCRYCEQTFSVKGILIRHLQQHKEQEGHKCEQCGKCYVNEAGLKRHLKINHPVVKEDIPCPYCLKTFTSVDYMKDHVRIFCKMKKLENQSQPSASSTTGEGDVTASTSGESVSQDIPTSSVITSGHPSYHQHYRQDFAADGSSH